MKITVLASGSKGNATIIETKKHNILIDAGITLSNAQKRINELPNIDVIIITHSHDDHIKGLKSFIKKYHPIIYTKSPELADLIMYDQLFYNDDIILDDIQIKLFELSHDVKCTGVSIKETEKELIYMTDTGYISKKIISKITNKDIYIIESNHDIDMLREGKYPFYLKQRIMGDCGHLSNTTAAEYLKKVIGPNTKNVILAHLSEENNTYEKAKITTEKIINNNIKLYIATQEESLETIEV